MVTNRQTFIGRQHPNSFFRENYWLLVSIILLLTVYAPAIFSVWGMHTDYSMLWKQPNSGWFGFIETQALLAVGRPVNAVTSNIIYNMANNVGDFIGWRLTGFVFMIIFLTVYGYYLNRYLKIERPWVALIVVLIGLLPASTVFVMWSSVVFQGFFNMLLACAAYFAFDYARHSSRHRLTWGAAAFLIYIICLFHYPPTSLIVFSFPFAHVVFANSNDWPQVRRRVFSDILFFGATLVVYRLIERVWVTPFFLSHMQYRPWQDYYNMNMCLNLPTKIKVIFEALGVSMAGPWHFIYGSSGVIIIPCMVTLIAVAAVARLQSFDIIERKNIFAERVLWIIVLFLLSILSVIIPKNVTYLLGYRLIFVSSLMGVLILAAVIKWSFERRDFQESWIRIFVGCFVLAAALIVSMTLSDIVQNYTREYNYVNDKLNEANLREIKAFVFIKLPDGQNLIRRNLYYEYNLMITVRQHYIPFILSAFKKAGINSDMVLVTVVPSDFSGRIIKRPDLLLFDPAQLNR